MKYIICGLEHVGLRLTEKLLELNEEVSVITLNRNESSLFYIKDRLTNYIEGDARHAEILKSAGINDADYLIIFTSNEIKNIEINCKAKEINPHIKTAILINNLSYANIIEQGFDVNFVFNLSTIVSLPIVSACINKNILHTIKGQNCNHYFSYINCDEHTFLLNKTVKQIEEEYNIKIVDHFYPEKKHSVALNTENVINGGSLVYITTNEIHFNRHDFLFQEKINSDLIFHESQKRFEFFSKLRVSKGIKKVLLLYSLLVIASVIIFGLFLKLSVINSIYFAITTTSTVGYGDFNLQNSPSWIKLFGCFTMLAGAALLATLFSVITDNIISKRLGTFAGIYNRKIKDHIIVAGLGSIGLSVVDILLKMGIKTVVIERDSENKNISLLSNKVPILIGDASEQKLLLKAGIKKAKTLASLIDDDLNNVNIILKGNSLKDELHTVARIFSNELNSKAKSTFQIDNVISASNVAVPFIICKLAYKNLIWAGYIHNKIYALVSFHISSNSKLIGLKKNEVLENIGMHPLLLERNKKNFYINEETFYQENDKIYLFCDLHSLRNIDKL